MGGDNKVDIALCDHSFACVFEGAVSNAPPMEVVVLAVDSLLDKAPVVTLGLCMFEACLGYCGLDREALGDVGPLLSEGRRLDIVWSRRSAVGLRDA